MPTGVVLTFRDYEALPADGRRYELHDGQLFVTAAPGVPHQRVVGRLFVLLRHHVEDHRLGEVLVSARGSLVSARGIEGPPTLAVEVVSHSTAQVDRGAKLQLYARLGIPYYWIVDPEQHSIDAYAAVDGVFRLIARLTGEHPGSLPPFSSLPIAAATLWP